MKKWIAILIGIVIFGALCSGGYKIIQNEKTAEQNRSDSIANFPEEINYESEHLKVQCKLDIPEGFDMDDLKEATAQTVILSDYDDKIYSSFSKQIKGTEYTEDEIYDDEGIKGTQKLWKKIDQKTHTTKMLNLYVSSMYYMTVGYLKCSLGSESLRTDEQENAYQTYPDGYKENSHMFLGDLSFATRKKAENELTNMFNQWGFQGKFDYESFGVSKDLVKQQYCYVKSDGSYETEISKKELKNFEDYYQLYGRQTFQGLPVFYYSGNGGIYREQCPIKAAVTVNGIEYLELQRIFGFREKNKKIDTFASVDQILETIKNRYEEIVSENSFEITKGGLYYYAKGNGNKKDFDMVPVWCFVVKERDRQESQIYESIFLINAETGKEMAYEP